MIARTAYIFGRLGAETIGGGLTINIGYILAVTVATWVLPSPAHRLARRRPRPPLAIPARAPPFS
jgi:hypothetical protein